MFRVIRLDATYGNQPSHGYRNLIRSKTMSNSVEMPKYKCIKDAWALKIKRVHDRGEDGGLIVPFDENYMPFQVDAGYVRKHKPVSGGYYVK